MTVTLTIVRYPKRFIPIALMAMALHRFPLWFNKNISFYKLLGCGRNGGFDKNPDWQQWGLLSVLKTPIGKEADPSIKGLYGPFIAAWYRFFHCELWTVLLEPLEGHGLWDGKSVFGQLPTSSDHEGQIAILTRATIRISKLKYFWKYVNGVTTSMKGAKGFITSIGIGDMPFLKQATFSIWKSKNDMKAFAYQMQEHKDVIKRTRQEKWYSEDMFVRFKVLSAMGTLRGIDPLPDYTDKGE